MDNNSKTITTLLEMENILKQYYTIMVSKGGFNVINFA
jgi:hypothetical protein